MSQQETQAAPQPVGKPAEPTAEQVRLFTERLLAMGGVPGRFWP